MRRGAAPAKTAQGSRCSIPSSNRARAPSRSPRVHEHGRALAGRDEGARSRLVERLELAARLRDLARPRQRPGQMSAHHGAALGQLHRAPQRRLPRVHCTQLHARVPEPPMPEEELGSQLDRLARQPELLFVLSANVVEEAAKGQAEAGEGVDRAPPVDRGLGSGEVAGQGQEETAPQMHGGLTRSKARGAIESEASARKVPVPEEACVGPRHVGLGERGIEGERALGTLLGERSTPRAGRVRLRGRGRDGRRRGRHGGRRSSGRAGPPRRSSRRPCPGSGGVEAAPRSSGRGDRPRRPRGRDAGERGLARARRAAIGPGRCGRPARPGRRRGRSNRCRRSAPTGRSAAGRGMSCTETRTRPPSR